MFCIHCGTKNEESYTFCQGCGKPMSDSVIPARPEPVPAAEFASAPEPPEIISAPEPQAPVDVAPTDVVPVAAAPAEAVPIPAAEPAPYISTPVAQPVSYTPAPIQPVEVAQPVYAPQANMPVYAAPPQSAAVFQPAAVAPPVQPLKKKKRIPLVIKLLIPLFLVIVLTAAGFYFYGSSITGPAKDVEKFLSAYYKKDWESVYDYLVVTEGDYAGRASFVEVMENTAKDMEVHKISDVKVTWTHSGGVVDSPVEEYAVSYTLDNGQTVSDTIGLVKQNKKSLLIFDTFKVDSSGSQLPYKIAQCKRYTVKAPKGATVTLSGVALQKSKDGEASSYAVQMDEYTAENAFAGEHSLVVAMPYGEVKKPVTVYTFDADVTVSASEFKLPADTVNKLNKSAEEFLTCFLEGIYFNKDVSTITPYLTNNTESRNKLITNYEDSAKNFKNQLPEGVSVKTVVCSDFNAGDDTSLNSNMQYISRISLKFDVTLTYTDANGTQEEVVPQTGQSTVYHVYDAESGKWLVESLG